MGGGSRQQQTDGRLRDAGHPVVGVGQTHLMAVRHDDHETRRHSPRAISPLNSPTRMPGHAHQHRHPQAIHRKPDGAAGLLNAGHSRSRSVTGHAFGGDIILSRRPIGRASRRQTHRQTAARRERRRPPAHRLTIPPASDRHLRHQRIRDQSLDHRSGCDLILMRHAAGMRPRQRRRILRGRTERKPAAADIQQPDTEIRQHPVRHRRSRVVPESGSHGIHGGAGHVALCEHETHRRRTAPCRRCEAVDAQPSGAGP